MKNSLKLTTLFIAGVFFINTNLQAALHQGVEEIDNIKCYGVLSANLVKSKKFSPNEYDLYTLAKCKNKQRFLYKNNTVFYRNINKLFVYLVERHRELGEEENLLSQKIKEIPKDDYRRLAHAVVRQEELKKELKSIKEQMYNVGSLYQ